MTLGIAAPSYHHGSVNGSVISMGLCVFERALTEITGYDQTGQGKGGAIEARNGPLWASAVVCVRVPLPHSMLHTLPYTNNYENW